MIRLAFEHIIWLYAEKETRRKREKETDVFDFWLAINMPRKRDILQRERERKKRETGRGGLKTIFKSLWMWIAI